LAMIKISISCVYCPQKMETVASNIITCCLRCELLFTHHHVIHWHNLPLPLQFFLLVITQPWKWSPIRSSSLRHTRQRIIHEIAWWGIIWAWHPMDGSLRSYPHRQKICVDKRIL
jgi:hypothetical protein